MSEPVKVECRDNVGIVTLNRPDKRNALDIPMRAAIAAAVRDLSGNPGVRVIVITGGDKVFAAGADLNLLVDKGSQEVTDLDLGQYWTPVAYCPKPVIAAINGVALGAGCELAMMCDILVADAAAKLGQPECKVGIMPGAGGTQRLVRAVGRPVASLMLMSGEPIAAERAWQLGLVSEITQEGKALERALVLAQQIAQMPPKAVAAIKRTLHIAADLPLDAALALENREFLLLFDTQDKSEGMRAFLEKRTPQYAGR